MKEITQIFWKVRVRLQHNFKMFYYFKRYASRKFRCCLIHATIIMVSHILYLLYMCPCLDLGLLISYQCDLLFIFSFIFIVINHITSFKQTYLFFVHFLERLLLFLDDNVEANNFQIAKDQPQGVTQLLFDFLSISAWCCL